MSKGNEVVSGAASAPSKSWRDLFPLPWSRLLPSCSWIKAANGEHALDVRGWGYLTGTGGGLRMSGHEATDIQAMLADEVVLCVNAHDAMFEALKKVQTELRLAAQYQHERAYSGAEVKIDMALSEIDAALSLAQGKTEGKEG